MRTQLWVGNVLISDATAAKIRAKHDVDPEEVRDTVMCQSGLEFAWHHHPERGTRAIVRAFIRDQPFFIVLYPARNDPFGDTFHLGSAYPDQK